MGATDVLYGVREGLARTMSGRFLELSRITVYEAAAEGAELRTGKDAIDLIGAAAEHRAAWIAIPVGRLGDDFFKLRTRVAGEMAQKFAMYGSRVAIVGDISARLAASKSLAAFVVESNRGRDLWFVASLQELNDRLALG
jgi:Domain of unknown function (DUF4180)